MFGATLMFNSVLWTYLNAGMCTRPSEPRQDQDVQNFVRDETLQLPRRWPRPWSSSLWSFNVLLRRFPSHMGKHI